MLWVLALIVVELGGGAMVVSQGMLCCPVWLCCVVLCVLFVYFHRRCGRRCGGRYACHCTSFACNKPARAAGC